MVPTSLLRARRASSLPSRSLRRLRFSRLQGQALEERTVMAVVPPAPTGFTSTTLAFTQPLATPIPAGPAVVTSTLLVSGVDPYLFDLNMTTFLSHTASGQLDVTLTSPGGTVVTITTGNGGTEDDVFDGTEWDDDGNPAGIIPYTLNDGMVTDHGFVNMVLASPLVPEEAMGAFLGENPNGIWTITISDATPADAGSLDSWSLEVTTLPIAPFTTTDSFNQPVPTPIPAGPTVVSSTINVSGLSPYLLDLDLTTFLSHTFPGDIDFTLTSPFGTVVTITTDNGGSNDDVFNGTVWDDDANPGGTLPYSFNNGLVTDHAYADSTLASPLVPEEAMAAFIGEDPNGVWTITISNDSATDAGSLTSWTLTIKAAAVFDFGDAPDPTYPTLEASDGARHIAFGPLLGLNRDNEIDALVSADAQGDDLDQVPDDEDGVSFSQLRAGFGGSATVTVSDAPSGALLNAWIDFNANGVWESGEQIANNLVVADGSNIVLITVPGGAMPGNTFARFRLSSSAVSSPTGVAFDGEVEDYQVNITPNLPPSPPGLPATTSTYTQSTPVVIPAGPGVVTSAIVIAGAGPYLFDLNMQTFLQHTFAADLQVTLTSPAGTVVSITTNNGGGNDNVFDGTIWDDDSDPAGQVPYVSNDGLVTDHAYLDNVVASPLAPEEAFGAFIGENPNGVWTLTISDGVPGDGGALNSWSLEISTIAAAPTTINVPITNSTPLAIPTGPGVVTSTIVVAGAPTYLFDVNLRTFLTHAFGEDLDITLMSPAGTIVTISTDNGGGNDNVFNGTVWDDDANPSGQVPYTNNNGLVTDHAYVNLATATPLVPEEALAAFIGENPNGVWTLTISDDRAGDGGLLSSWTLDLSYAVSAFVPGTATVIPDPLFPGDDVLQVNGTDKDDVILIDPISGSRTQVKLNGKVIGVFPNASFDRIWVNGLLGNDKVIVNPTITKPARLYGNDGNDKLYGAAGIDSLDGGNGNDFLYAGKSNDTLLGNIGDDFLYGEDGNDTASGGDGTDRIYGDAGDDSMDGGIGNDSLYGGAGNDTAQGGSGNDLLYGDAGIDLLFGGDDADKMYGGIGNDTASGGEGEDAIYGDAGNDSLEGNAGNDSLNGGAGSDLVRGGLGNDRLNGGTENDILLGEDNDDTILGEHGRDILIGGDGADKIGGGEHEDLLIAGTTIYDGNNAALLALLAEWIANRAYAIRVGYVRTGTGPILTGTGFMFTPGVTTADDGDADVLTGNLANDWFIADAGDTTTDQKLPLEFLN